MPANTTAIVVYSIVEIHQHRVLLSYVQLGICLSTPAMSLYPQSQAYSQVGYPYAAQAYPHPSPPQPAYQPPFQPQAAFYADPNHFRRDYSQRLAQLTFNSRPHIQSLSMIAQDYTRYADIVVQCVEQHIRRVSHPVLCPLSHCSLSPSLHL